MTLRFLLLIILSLSVTNAYAWGLNGHRIVADIAQNNLSNEAKKLVISIQDELNLSKIATYPDDVRSAPDEQTFSWAKCIDNKCSDYQQLWSDALNWHFVDVTDDFKPFDDINAKVRIQQAIDILRYSENKLTRKSALSWLVHLVGDINQPLHTGRRSDIGGNTISVTFFSSKTNLHSVWDSKIIKHFSLSYKEYSNFLSTSNDYITYPIGYFSDKNQEILATDDLQKMLNNTIEEAKIVYAGVPEDKKLGFDYVYQTAPIVSKQLLTAGVSLAIILNKIADNSDF